MSFLREKEVRLVLFGLGEQSQKVGESCRGKRKVDNMENILTVGIVCISCSWRQAFFRDEEEIETFDVDNERLA